jgi:thiamine biosynthesis lipoprotein
MSQCDVSFRAMGCAIRVIVGPQLDHASPPPAQAAYDAQRWTCDYDRRMSRFRSDSELSRLNADPRAAVPASALLRATVRAGIWAAERTDGLVDPTLVTELEAAGYAQSMADSVPAPLADALAAAPMRRPAKPGVGRWKQVDVDDAARVIRRPPGLRLDSGGAGKGLAADALVHRLRAYSRVAVDCGGDIRVAGPEALDEPFEIEIEHPLTGTALHRLCLSQGAIATSGIGTRIWRTPAGGFGHHLIDPATGCPAWTGLVSATALAPTALEAETLSKAALLGGPPAARAVLARHGGAFVRDDGSVELVGVLREAEAVPA